MPALVEFDFVPSSIELRKSKDLNSTEKNSDKDIDKIMSITKTESNVYKPKIYTKVASNFIYIRK